MQKNLDNVILKVLADSFNSTEGSQESFTVLIITVSNLKEHVGFTKNSLDFARDITMF